MDKYTTTYSDVHAKQITEATFKSAREAIPGVFYFPLVKKVTLPGRPEVGQVGDWIVRAPDGRLEIMSDVLFQHLFGQQ